MSIEFTKLCKKIFGGKDISKFYLLMSHKECNQNEPQKKAMAKSCLP